MKVNSYLGWEQNMLSFVKTLKRVLIAFLLIFTGVLTVACSVATPVPTATSTTIPTSTSTSVQDLSTPIHTPTSQDLDTPTLINQAFDRGEITEEERLLHLASALYEYESLPAQFRGNGGWRATSVVAELYETVNDPSILCSMSAHVRSELLRLVKKTDDDTVCN